MFYDNTNELERIADLQGQVQALREQLRQAVVINHAFKQSEQNLEAALDAERVKVRELEEWKQIVIGTGTDRETVIRMAASEYTKSAVRSWKDAHAKLQSQVAQLKQESDKFYRQAMQYEHDLYGDPGHGLGVVHHLKELRALVGALEALIPKHIKLAIAADGDGLYETLTKLVTNFECLQAQVDQLRKNRDLWIATEAQSQQDLSRLRGLVEALPVEKEVGVIESLDDFYVAHTTRFSIRTEAEAYAALLTYRATLAQPKGEE